jgi:hypothetical protein
VLRKMLKIPSIIRVVTFKVELTVLGCFDYVVVQVDKF